MSQHQRHQHAKDGAAEVDEVVIEPGPAALEGGARPAGVQRMALGLFVAGGAVVDGLDGAAQQRVEQGAEQTGQGDDKAHRPRDGIRDARSPAQGRRQKPNQRGPAQSCQRADQRDTARCAFFDFPGEVRDHARRARAEHAQFGGPGIGVDGCQAGGKGDPDPRRIGVKKVQTGKQGGQPAVAENLTGVALAALGEFFVETGLAFFEGAGQRAG